MRVLRFALFAVSAAANASAQVTVNSGSTGADGAFAATLSAADRRLPAGTLIDCTGADPRAADACRMFVPLREPPNHVFNFTTVVVDANVTVRFIRNASNTPVFILATGDVGIRGTIDVSAEAQGLTAGPGGFNGGYGPHGGGSGPGGGYGRPDPEPGERDRQTPAIAGPDRGSTI